MAASNYLETALLNHIRGSTSFTQPSGLYVGLFHASPEDDGSGLASEVSGGGYARQAIIFGIPDDGRIANTGTIEFTNINGASNTPITHIGIFDAQSGGNLLFHGPLLTPKNIVEGGDAQFAPGSIGITLS